jgi:hypothetical protein
LAELAKRQLDELLLLDDVEIWWGMLPGEAEALVPSGADG